MVLATKEEIQMKEKNIPKDGWQIELNRTALVVVDMQRAFMDVGAPLEIPGARDLVPGINQLAATCRKLSIPVFFIKANRRADLSDSGLFRDFIPLNNRNNQLDSAQGKKGNEFYPSLEIIQMDHVVPKIRYSAFIPGSSTIESQLKSVGRDAIIICGIATDVCGYECG
jgi:ureidoacrylate peracid hydrolase